MKAALTTAERNALMPFFTLLVHTYGSVAVVNRQTVMANGTKLFCLFYPTPNAANQP